MLHSRFIRLLLGAIVGACLIAPAAAAQQGPPSAAHGKPIGVEGLPPILW